MSGKKLQSFLERCFGLNADEDGVQRYSELTEKGQELPDPVPKTLIVPGPYNKPLGQQIEEAIWSSQMAQLAREQGFDTPEEADDLDVPDDPLDPLTPWEDEFLAADQRRQARFASQRASAGERVVETPSVPEDKVSRSEGRIESSASQGSPQRSGT